MTKDFSVAPYFDDFDKNKNFLKVLFQPGRPVQTRELNQLQSILQNQISNSSDHFFENGSMIIPGNLFYDNNVVAIKLNPINSFGISADIIASNLLSKNIENDNGVVANVLHYEPSTGESGSFTTLFIKYTSGSADGTQLQFNDEDIVSDVDNSNNSVQLSVDASSFASIATLSDGIFYVNGNFVNVYKQTVVLDTASKTPTARVGLKVVEEIVTESDDESLYDNALGYSNFAAPGAHRFKVSLVLEKRTFDYNDDESAGIEKFIDLLHIKNGNIIMLINDTNYAELERMFARRTYDESGNYEVAPFEVAVHEYRNNNRGSWAASQVYLLGDIVTSDGVYWEARTSGVSGGISLDVTNINQSDGGVEWVQVKTPLFNRGVNVDSSSFNEQLEDYNKIVYRISPGKAYINGYEFKTIGTTDIVSTKAIEASYDEQEVTPVAVGSWTQVTNLKGIPNIDQCELVQIYPHKVGDFVGTTATATYTVSGGAITAVTITEPGRGYTIQNQPTITAPSGTGASFKAVINAAGQVTEIKIVSGGTGYTADSLTIAAPTEQSIGSCRVRSVEYTDGVLGSGTELYALQIFDLKINPGYEAAIHARSLLSIGSTGFSADVVTRDLMLEGLSTYQSATKDITGVNTNYKNLVVGQTILIDGNEYIISSIDSNLGLNTVTNITTTGANQVFVKVSNFRTTGALLLPLPKASIKTVRNAEGEINTSYTVKRRFKDVSVVGSSLTLNIPSTDELFATSGVGNYIVSDQDTKNILTFTNVVATGQEVTISGLSLASGTVEVLATISKSGQAAREKVKTLTTKTIDIRNVAQLKGSELSLTEADVYRIVKVYKVVGAGVEISGEYPVVGSQELEDISSDFKLHDGQTPFYYGIGKIIRDSSVVAPNNTIRVIFEYYQHSAGDYFTVDSYVNVPKDKINSILRDCLDFRPRISDNGNDYLTSNGASVTEPIVDASYFICDYGYYLPRVDVITLNPNKTFQLQKGKPGYSLIVPQVNLNDMTIAKIVMPPGINRVSSNTVIIDKVENQRFTMNDIGKLKNRIESLEYYTQLSLLESEALTQDVVDQNGMTRFKSGILVDSFETQNIADGFNPDFLITMDHPQGECRSFISTNLVEFREENVSESQRITNHYTLTGSSLTLPYTEALLFNQPMASKTENINPFSVILYKGQVELVPDSDTWIETQFEGDIPGRTTTITQTLGRVDLVWNNWDNWFGTAFAPRSVAEAISMFAGNNNVRVVDVGVNRFNGSITGVTRVTIEGNINQAWLNDFSRSRAAGISNSTTFQTQTTVPSSEAISTTFSPTTSPQSTRRADDIVLASIAIPNARTIPISFKLEKARPFTKYDATFGGVNVINNLDMATDVVLASIGTVPLGLDYKDNTELGSNALQRTARTVTTDKIRQYTDMPIISEHVWDRGEIVVQYVTGSSGTTSATAVVMNVAYVESVPVIKLINVKGTFVTNKAIYVIRNSLPQLVSSTISSISVPDKVLTDKAGSAYGVFYPPCTTAQTVPAGEIKFIVNNEGTDFASPSSAEASFVSNGVQEIVRRNPPLQPIRQPTTTILSDQWGDPLAQTFMINESSSIVGRDSSLQSASGQGAFITSVGIYFKTKDSTLPVTIQIRTVENGFPSSGVIASRQLFPHEVMLSEDGSVETRVYFRDPVFLQNNTEYAVVLMTDSIRYNVWVARMGEIDIATNQAIVTQPTLGLLFKSQNSSTWSEEQLEDLKFNIYRAKFDISRSGNIDFVNKSLPRVMIRPSSLFAVEGSTDIRVEHENHGLNNGDKVTITNYTNGPFSTGLDLVEATVSDTGYDSYTLAGVGNSVAAYTGYFGGNVIEVDRNIKFSTLMPKINEERFIGTDTTLFLTTMKDDYTFVENGEVQNFTNQHYTTMMQIAHYDNEQTFVMDADKKSLRMRAAISSMDDFFSPVINVDNVTAVAVRNVINNPDETINKVFDDVVLCDSVSVEYDHNDLDIQRSYIKVTGSAYTSNSVQLNSVSIGKYIRIDNPTAGTASANATKKFMITDVVKESNSITIYVDGVGMIDEVVGSKNTKLVMLNRYVDEIAPFGTTVYSTYIAQKMNLQIQCSAIKVTFDINKPADTYIDVYYRSALRNDDISIDNKRWYKINPSQALADMSDPRSFTEVSFEENNIPVFDIAQVKIVFRSDNPAMTSRIKNLRVMTLA